MHIGPVSVAEGRKSTAFWSTQPSGTAVVFVHGFGGQSVGTWSQFEMRLPADPRAAGADIVFFGYDGLRAPALASAAILRGMIDHWMCHPTIFVNGTLHPDLHRNASPPYQKLIVVAHSLGAVVARKALLDAFKANHAWLANVRLVLFAPAHRGASALALAKSSLGGFDFLLATLGLVQHFSVLADLDPDGPFLTTLVEHHKEAVKEPRGHALAAKALVVPPADKIVHAIDFLLADAQPEVIPNTTHTSVCKPTDGVLEPLDIIRRFL